MNHLIFQHIGLAVFIAIVSSMVFIRVLIPIAKRVGLVDLPGGRKHHDAPTPVVAGIAMYLAFCLSILMLDISLQPYRILLASSLLLIFTGVLDDFHELTPRFRLAVQVMVGLLMAIWGQTILLNLGNLFFIGNVELNYTLGVIVSVCAVIGVINAVNMLDGVDGLVASIVAIQLALLIYLAAIAGLFSEVRVLFVLIAVILGYLWYNFPFPWRKRAIVFMGDAGSMFLGFILVWFTIYLSQPPHRAASPAVFLWIMALPLFDVGALLIRRPLNNRSPLSADRAHIHHLLQAAGCSKLATVLLLSAGTLGLGLIGILGSYYQLSSRWLFIAFIVAFLIYVVMTEFLWRKLKIDGRKL